MRDTPFVHEVENLYEEYRRGKERIEEVKKKIRETIADKYFKYENLKESAFLFAFSLYMGEFYKYTSSFGGRYFIEKDRVYNNDTKQFENALHYGIYERISGFDTYATTNKHHGFICYKKDLAEVIPNDVKRDIWIGYVKDNRKDDSFNEFYAKCEAGMIDFFELCDNFYRKHKNGLHLMNYPSLKIKDVVICC